jgi:hypothetical protein
MSEKCDKFGNNISQYTIFTQNLYKLLTGKKCFAFKNLIHPYLAPWRGKPVSALLYFHNLNFTWIEDAIICEMKYELHERTLPLQKFALPLLWFYRGRTSKDRNVAWSLLTCCSYQVCWKSVRSKTNIMCRDLQLGNDHIITLVF